MAEPFDARWAAAAVAGAGHGKVSGEGERRRDRIAPPAKTAVV
jgi:hypothetical protein